VGMGRMRPILNQVPSGGHNLTATAVAPEVRHG
jgi:hypothetical protein